MPLGERFLRLVEKRLLPWFDREDQEAQIVAADQAIRVEDAKAEHTAEIERDSAVARMDSKNIRKAYAAAGKRLGR